MPKKKSFEASLEELEQIVKTLETGDLPIEEAVKKFETGMACSKFCMEKLDEIEKKVTKLINDREDNIKEVPFGHE